MPTSAISRLGASKAAAAAGVDDERGRPRATAASAAAAHDRARRSRARGRTRAVRRLRFFFAKRRRCYDVMLRAGWPAWTTTNPRARGCVSLPLVGVPAPRCRSSPASAACSSPASLVLGYFTTRVVARFDGRRWNLPSRIYSDLYVLRAGRRGARSAALAAKLERLFYQETTAAPERPGPLPRAGRTPSRSSRAASAIPGRLVPGLRACASCSARAASSRSTDAGGRRRCRR